MSLPEAARRLIFAHIPTIPHLETLVLAHSCPSHAWRPAELAQRLYIPTRTAQSILLDLVQSSLLELVDAQRPSARLATTDQAMVSAVRELVEVYSRHVVEVTRLVHAYEGSAVQRLADAFRVGRRK